MDAVQVGLSAGIIAAVLVLAHHIDKCKDKLDRIIARLED